MVSHTQLKRAATGAMQNLLRRQNLLAPEM